MSEIAALWFGNSDRSPVTRAPWVIVALLFGALVGTVVVALAGKSGATPLIGLAVALSVGLMGLFLLLMRIDGMLALILVTRSSLEPLLILVKGNSEGMGPGAAINALIIVLALVYLVRQPRAFARPHVLVWGIFLAIAFSAFRYSPNPPSAIRMLLIYLTYFVMFSVPLQVIHSRQDTRKWIWVVLLASIVPTIAGLVDTLTGGITVIEPSGEGEEVFGIPEYQGFRIEGAFSHPNIYAFFLVTIIVALLYAIRLGIFEKNWRWQGMAWVYLGLQVVLLLCTQTRGAWAGLALVMIAYGIFLDRRVLLLILVMMVLMMFVPVVQDRILDVLSSNAARPDDELNSYQWRLAMWRSAIPWIEDRLLLGWGLDSYTEYSTIFFPLEYIVPFDAHNVYIQLAFELGLPGVFAFLMIFIAMLVLGMMAWRRHRTEAVLLSALVGAFLLACYSDNMHRYLVANWYTFFVLGTLCATATLPPAEVERMPR